MYHRIVDRLVQDVVALGVVRVSMKLLRVKRYTARSGLVELRNRRSDKPRVKNLAEIEADWPRAGHQRHHPGVAFQEVGKAGAPFHHVSERVEAVDVRRLGERH